MTTFAELLDEAERRPLVGWDLTLAGRITSTPPWDFEAMVDRRIATSPDLLDMGTGGGERLSRRPFPKGRTVATEAWPPNVPVAHARLSPLGASVVAVVGAPDNVDQAGAASLPALPFADGSFHLVVNRHESFVAAEVARVLSPGGRFLTQQVGPDLGEPFRALLDYPPSPDQRPWNLARALHQVRGAGLDLTDAGEAASILTFADVGALAWYLLRVPWVMPEFSIKACRERLEGLHGRGVLTTPQSMFWLTALRAA